MQKSNLKTENSAHYEHYEELLKESRKAKDFNEILAKNGPLSEMLKKMLETILKEEMTAHLGYEKHDASSKETENSRNGTYKKNIKSSNGKMEIEIPRDRLGEFEPKIIPKFSTKTAELEQKIISMYAKGMSTADISNHISNLYLDADVSPTFISQVTNKVIPLAKEWQSRGLDKVYPIVFFDAIHYKIREEGKVVSRAVCIPMAINLEGIREVLGFYVGEAESSKFCLSLFTDLNTRGIKDILIACADGLKGMPEAIKTIFCKNRNSIVPSTSN